MDKDIKIGEISYNKSTGEKIVLTAYRSYYDIDVQFEDGTIRRNVSYIHF